jgi:hypothetical protein
MDAVWIKTVRQLEIDLAGYRQAKRTVKLERDGRLSELNDHRLSRLKESLSHRYSQLIAFTAGLSIESVLFDCDLEVPATVKRNSRGFSFVFGPSAVSSVSPYLSSEFTEFADYIRERQEDKRVDFAEQEPRVFISCATKHLRFCHLIVTAAGVAACDASGLPTGAMSQLRDFSGMFPGHPQSCPPRLDRLERFTKALTRRLAPMHVSARGEFDRPDFEYLT